jgi:multicomponent Na+:H+ antiporter subunit E
MRIAARLVLLVGLWILAWGEASVANVASGLLLAALLLVAFPPAASTQRRLRPSVWGMLRLGGYVLGQLVTSNVLVAREIVSRGSRVRTGVLAYDVRHPVDEVVTLVANVIALTPGTMTVEATRDPTVLYVHFLLLDDIEHARGAIARLEDLVVGALRPRSPEEGAA